MSPIVVEAMKGLGDGIYQRPFIRAAASRGPVWIETPWPELYSDLDVRFSPMRTPLRTQAKNLARQTPDRFTAPPIDAARVKMGYGREIGRRSIMAALEAQLPLDGSPFLFDLPAELSRPWLRVTRPIAVVRPVTVRKEWRNEARNPLPVYVADAAAELMETHFVILVADLQDGEEEAAGALPPHHLAFVRGELSVELLLRLISQADVVIGGVGFLVPAAIALQTPAYFVLGGQGGHNGPDKITDPRMNLDRIGFARPDRFCSCDRMLHRCNKLIPNFSERFRKWTVTTLSSCASQAAASNGSKRPASDISSARAPSMTWPISIATPHRLTRISARP